MTVVTCVYLSIPVPFLKLTISYQLTRFFSFLMSIYGQIIILLACYRVVITFASLALDGRVLTVDVGPHFYGFTSDCMHDGVLLFHISYPC